MASTDPPSPSTPGEKFVPFDPEKGADPARYVVLPGDGKTNPGQLRHIRPRLLSGSKSFSWPVGIEGFRVSGQAQLSLHHYIGASIVTAKTLHKEEGRITLNGVFPGWTSQPNMIKLRDTLRSTPAKRGMTLFMQGVFNAEQFVLPEAWEFNHIPEDRTHSIEYSVTFVHVGTGAPISDPAGNRPPEQPGSKSDPKGKGKVFVTRAGARTFRQIAKIVYGSASQWPRLVDMNGKLIGLQFVPGYMIPTVLWPIGVKIRY